MPDPLREVRRAFDEARYGAERTLNLREALPTPEQAVARLDGWIRQRQVDRAGEVLVISGRGNIAGSRVLGELINGRSLPRGCQPGGQRQRASQMVAGTHRPL